jgi:hypothetical protein
VLGVLGGDLVLEGLPLLAGEPATVDTGTARKNNATTFARCTRGNQYVRYRMIPGKKPASATPSRNRTM